MTGGLVALGVLNSVVVANAFNFAALTPAHFQTTVQSTGVTVYSATVQAKSSFTTVVPSWTGRTPEGSSIEVYLCPQVGDSGVYCLGKWSQYGARTSINGQDDPTAKVDTDVLSLKKPCDRINVIVRAIPAPTGAVPTLDTFNLSLDGTTQVSRRTPDQGAPPPAILEPPRLAQMSYEGGGVLCSPTAVAMVLGYWSSVLERPDLKLDVPIVQAGVNDPGWPGTGNWPFNVAFAGSLPGMTGFVTRMTSVEDLALWLSHGVPIATSVRYNLLKGNPPGSGDGHLVLLVGFEPNGDPVFNDPGRNIVRMTYKRADFEKAWTASGRTCYVIHPLGWKTPTATGPWPQPQATNNL